MTTVPASERKVLDSAEESTSLICIECGIDVTKFDHAFYHCHDCGLCEKFNPTDHEVVRQLATSCILCCGCANGPVLKSHPDWAKTVESEDVAQPEAKKFDPYYEVNYTNELASYLSTIFPENFPWRENEYRLRAHNAAQRAKQGAANQASERLVAKWGEFPKKPLTVIACPFPDCNHHCIDRGTKPLAEVFDSHVQRVHNVKPTKACLELIELKIKENRSLKFRHYQDPFLYVSLESVTQE